LERNRTGAGDEARDDRGEFHEAVVAAVVRRVVAERDEVVLEAAGHHVEIDAPPVEERERRDHLRDRVRVHVERLHRHERGDLARALDDDLRDEPRIEQAVVGVDEDPGAARLLAPARHRRDEPCVVARVFTAVGRRGRVEEGLRGHAAPDENDMFERHPPPDWFRPGPQR
jgi:hypothetical protein